MELQIMTNQNATLDLFTEAAKTALASCNSLRNMHDTAKKLIDKNELGQDFDPKRNNAFEMPVALLQCNVEESIRSEFDQEQIRSIADAYLAGDYVKPLGVAPTNGKLRVVLGFTSYQALLLANSEGAGIKRVWVVQVDGGRAKEVVRQCVDSFSVAVSPLDLAKAYSELVNVHDYSAEQIALETHRNERHVRKMLALLDVPEEVREMVGNGQVSVTRALSADRQCKAKGQDTVVHMKEQLEKAQRNGSNKITSKSTGAAPAALYGRKDLDVAAPVLVQLADQLENALPIMEAAPEDLSITLKLSAADFDLKELALSLANLRAAFKSAQGATEVLAKAV
ncbi:hypothetical protein [Pseudomonas putida]|jgi:hypothetical protein|nr:Predicted transcriptional regulators [Pseudomonas putida]WVM70187.1 hypothetical protein V1687_27940 [Pseudomonas putida]